MFHVELLTRFRAIALLLLASVLLLGCSRGSKTKELVVGMDLSYPPFETIDASGKPMGVSVELARALADYLHEPLRIENMPFVGLIPALQNGSIDCVISSMTDTPARREAISFSEPYLTIGLALLVNARSGITTLADIDQPGKTVVVRLGTTGEVWAREHIKSATVRSMDKENTAVLEVIQGKADAFIYDQMSVWQNAKNNATTIRAILDPLKKEEWAVGIRKGNTELQTQINAFLKQYREQGGFEQLGDRFLPEQKREFQEKKIPFYF
ncbi:transporter substrate-binding domain-containing protein [soil metagenome]